MQNLVCVVLGVGCCFHKGADKSYCIAKLQDELQTTIEEKTGLRPKRSNIKLYVAKRYGEWIYDNDAKDLRQGDLPLCVEDILTAENLMDPEDKIGDEKFGFRHGRQGDQIDLIIVRVPSSIQKRLRVVYASRICYYKLQDYNGNVLLLVMVLAPATDSFVLVRFRFRFGVLLCRLELRLCSPRLGNSHISAQPNVCTLFDRFDVAFAFVGFGAHTHGSLLRDKV
ncbi:hypothetical protein PHYPSEUDO_006435 [Phytophthora pseudosyringae]|uniref:Uncharacterized protein n=1 Tax=Phytophthora pseudosyringae TaxID=221518 RepID=A0A8T1VP58_9STRA|nr:hypothetical protein PHYPSEUDO_006435 [Phytophthora pseudosyringae]